MAEILLIGIITLCGLTLFGVGLIGQEHVDHLAARVETWSVSGWIIGPVLLSVAYVLGIAANTVGRFWSRGFSRHAKVVALLGITDRDDRAVVRRVGRVGDDAEDVLGKLRSDASGDLRARVHAEWHWWLTLSPKERRDVRKAVAQCFRHLRAAGLQSPAGSKMLNEHRSLLRVARGSVFGLALGVAGSLTVSLRWGDADIKVGAACLCALGALTCCFSFAGYVVRQLASDRYLVAFLLQASKEELALGASGVREGER